MSREPLPFVPPSPPSPACGPGHVVGVDLGGTRMRAAVASLDGTIEAEAGQATDATDDRVVAQLLTLIEELTEKAGYQSDNLRAAVIGVPGVVDEASGVVRDVPHLPALGRQSVIEALRDGLPVTPRLENDVNLAALAEWEFGGHDCATVAVLALGTGVGLGTVVRGELLRGDHLAAGEVAALPFGGDPFSSAGVGRALESVLSGAALVRSYRATSGRELATAAEVFAAAGDGDRQAHGVVEVYARDVARAVMAVAAVLDPGVVALTGGIGSDPYLLPCVAEWLRRGGMDPDVVVASKLGPRAGIVGAVAAAAYAGSSRPVPSDSAPFS